MVRKSRSKFTASFKEDAVKLVLEKSYTIEEAANRLAVSKSALGKWVRLAKEKACGTGLSFSEREELNQLRKEAKRLRMERDILKKAAVFFASEQE